MRIKFSHLISSPYSIVGVCVIPYLMNFFLASKKKQNKLHLILHFILYSFQFMKCFERDN